MEKKASSTANLMRLEEFMTREQLDAIVVRSGQNFTYLSGIAYRSTHGRQLDMTDSPRGTILVWPKGKEPLIIVNGTMERLTLRESWIKRLEVYDCYSEFPYSRLCAVMKDLGLGKERVGFEKSFVSAKHWEEIQRTFPQLRMVDCTDMMDQVRWIKTPAEVALLKEGADLLDDAFMDVFRSIRPGDTERDVHGRLIYGCIRRGAELVHGCVGASTNDSENSTRGWRPYYPQYLTDEAVFHKGDIIWDDYISYVQGHGYPGHQSRNAVIGEPNEEQKRNYRIVRDVYRKVIDRCRVGTKAGDVYDVAVSEFKKYGWEFNPAFKMVGHSVGTWWHQQEPILSSGSATVLEEGMVFAIELNKYYWHIQDLVLIKSDGPELISNKMPTDQLFTIG